MWRIYPTSSYECKQKQKYIITSISLLMYECLNPLTSLNVCTGFKINIDQNFRKDERQ